jgi:hypothetical protein
MDTRKIHIALENIDDALYGIGLKHIRTVNAYLLTPILKLTGFRFSKDYRYCSTIRHRLVYMVVDTVKANRLSTSREELRIAQSLNDQWLKEL